MIEHDELAALTADADKWLRPLNDAMAAYDIGTAAREANFLAQIAHESAGFARLDENLNYSPAGLLKTFAKYFTADDAVVFAHDPRRIACRVYANRMGNGDEASGDGYRYRGRGLIQLTGRAMYARCGKAIGLDLEGAPEQLLEPPHAALSAAWYWQTNGCNELADDGNFTAITRKINGGLNGLEDRQAWLDKANTALA